MNKLLTGVAMATVALASASVTAQRAPPLPPGVDQGTAPMAMTARHTPPVVRSPVQVRGIFNAAMTRDQLVRHVRTMFAHLDANGDGYVTRNEATALHGRMMAGMHCATAPSGTGHSSAGGDHEMGMADPARMFDRLDTNRDGVIGRQEFMAAHARMHERRVMIMEHDDMMGGSTGTRPMRMHMRGMGAEEHGGGFAARLFDMADANHDGRVSLHEAEAAALAHFDRIDVNHDGRVTSDERRQAHTPMRLRRPG